MAKFRKYSNNEDTEDQVPTNSTTSISNNTNTQYKSSADWYDASRINSLLTHYLSDDKTDIFAAIHTSDELDNILNNLNSKRLNYIIPLNVSAIDASLNNNTNHWVALYIRKNIDDTLNISYIDPMGRNINNAIKQLILQHTNLEISQPLLGEGIHYVKGSDDIEIKGNINDCGPMLIYALNCYMRALDLPNITIESNSLALGQYLREKFDIKAEFNEINKNAKHFQTRDPYILHNNEKESKKDIHNSVEETKLDNLTLSDILSSQNRNDEELIMSIIHSAFLKNNNIKPAFFRSKIDLKNEKDITAFKLFSAGEFKKSAAFCVQNILSDHLEKNDLSFAQLFCYQQSKLQLGCEALLESKNELAIHDLSLSALEIVVDNNINLRQLFNCLSISEQIFTKGSIYAPDALINILKMSLKFIDPECSHHNYYQNIAANYVNKGDLNKAQENFELSLKINNNSGVDVEYAQFLIIKSNQITCPDSKITDLLYSSMDDNALNAVLYYNSYEENNVCNTIKSILSRGCTSLHVKSKVLAYHLLLSNKKYIKKDDNAENILLKMHAFCSKYVDLVSLELLKEAANIYNNKNIVIECNEKLQTYSDCNALINGEKNFDNTKNIKNIDDLQKIVVKFFASAKIEFEENNFFVCKQLYEGLLLLHKKYWPDNLVIQQDLLDRLFTISILERDDNSMQLKLLGAELNSEILNILPIEYQQHLTNINNQITQQALQIQPTRQENPIIDSINSVDDDNISTTKVNISTTIGNIADQNKIIQELVLDKSVNGQQSLCKKLYDIAIKNTLIAIDT